MFIMIKQHVSHVSKIFHNEKASPTQTLFSCNEPKAFVMERTNNDFFVLAICFTATFFPHQGSSFNLDLTNYIEFSGPKGSYFGFSVDFFQARSQK